MKKTIALIGAGIFTLIMVAQGSAEPPSPIQFVDCNDCHGLSPGISGKQKNFNPGAHPIHGKIQCDKCHAEGGAPFHVDGIITLIPEIGYSNGTEVPWPSVGGGSCGGRIFVPGASGCHADPAVRYNWTPDGK